MISGGCACSGTVFGIVSGMNYDRASGVVSGIDPGCAGLISGLLIFGFELRFSGFESNVFE